MIPTLTCGSAVGLLLALSPVVQAATVAAVSSEFTSPLTESWDAFPLRFLTSYPTDRITLLDGFATATGASLCTYTPGVYGPNHFGLGPFTAKVHDGNQGFGVSSTAGNVTFAFASPVSAFGGFWGVSVYSDPVTVTFLDALGNPLGQTSLRYGKPNNDGTLEWHGWVLDTPASSITLAGEFFVNDSLRVIPVPEASTCLFFALGLLGIAGLRSRQGLSYRGCHRSDRPDGISARERPATLASAG